MKGPQWSAGKSIQPGFGVLAREARIRASEVKEAAFAMRDVDMFSKMGVAAPLLLR